MITILQKSISQRWSLEARREGGQVWRIFMDVIWIDGFDACFTTMEEMVAKRPTIIIDYIRSTYRVNHTIL